MMVITIEYYIFILIAESVLKRIKTFINHIELRKGLRKLYYIDNT